MTTQIWKKVLYIYGDKEIIHSYDMTEIYTYGFRQEHDWGNILVIKINNNTYCKQRGNMGVYCIYDTMAQLYEDE